jgi:hypothetical protein
MGSGPNYTRAEKFSGITLLAEPQTQSSLVRLFPGVHLRCLLGENPYTAGVRIDDLHVVPIVGEFFATAQADKIRPGDGRDNRTRLAFAAGNQGRAFFMATAKHFGPGDLNQFNKHRHLTNGGPSEVERTKPQNAR